jgi:uncharacterized protein (TIGR02001 family)
MIKKYFATLALIGTVSYANTETPAIEADLGIDIATRYVWRGLDFGNSPSLQPSFSLSASGFEIGSWAAYSISADSVATSLDEHDIWVGYANEIAEGHELSVAVTDYYFPSATDSKYLDYKDGGGSHNLEASLGYSGLLNLSTSWMFYNDDDNSVYWKVGYPFSIQEVELEAYSGGTLQKSGLYGTRSFEAAEVGLSLSKDIAVNKEFSIPFTVNFVVNPTIEKSYLVASMSF